MGGKVVKAVGNAGNCCKTLSFHCLPADSKLRKKWIVKIRQLNLPVNSYLRVCGVHFCQGEKKGAVVPDTFLWTKRKKERQTRSAQSAGVCSEDKATALLPSSGADCSSKRLGYDSSSSKLEGNVDEGCAARTQGLGRDVHCTSDV